MAKDHWDANRYQIQHNFVYEYGRDLLEWLAPQAGETILDLGCGTGQLTAEIAKQCAAVIGIDASPSMIKHAKENDPSLAFHIDDARSFTVDAPVDAVFSNAALHWVRPPEDAVRQIAKALKPGGRFVAEFGGKGNVALAHRAMCHARGSLNKEIPVNAVEHYFPSIAEYTSILETSGLEPIRASLFDRPTPLENGDCGLRNWFQQFMPEWLGDLSAKETDALFKAAEVYAKPGLHRDGQWFMDYRRLRILAMKP